MNYKSWSDEALRRVLLTDPYDTVAICEASDRFAKQKHEDEDSDKPHEFDVPVECPECGHEWGTPVDFNDYVDWV